MIATSFNSRPHRAGKTLRQAAFVARSLPDDAMAALIAFRAVPCAAVIRKSDRFEATALGYRGTSRLTREAAVMNWRRAVLDAASKDL